MLRSILTIGLTIGIFVTSIGNLEGARARCDTGSITGTLMSKSGTRLKETPVFLALPVPDDQSMPPIMSDPRFEPLMYDTGEYLWDMFRDFHAKEDTVFIYVIPYFDNKNVSQELFATKTNQKGEFLFESVWPGTYYIVAGASPKKAFMERKDALLIPVGFTGTIVNYKFEVIGGEIVAYVLLGEGQVTADLFNVDACKRKAAGLIQLNIMDE